MSSTQRLSIVLAFALSSWLLPARGTAQELHARTHIEWDEALVAAGCSTRESVVAAVEARIHRPLGATGPEDAELILEARRLEGEALIAELTLIRAGGEVLGVRRIETTGPRCDTLDAGLPLVIAMLVDLHEQEAILILPDPVPIPAPVVSAPAPGPDLPPPAEERVWGSLETGASLDVFGLPVPAVGVQVLSELGTDRSPLSAMVRVTWVTPQTSYAVGAVEVWGAYGSAGGCLRAEPQGLAVGGCILVEAGVLHIAGQGFDVSRASDAPHLAAVALLEGVLLSLSPFTFRVELGASVPFVVQRFVYDDLSGLSAYFVASPVTIRAGLLLGLRVF